MLDGISRRLAGLAAALAVASAAPCGAQAGSTFVGDQGAKLLGGALIGVAAITTLGTAPAARRVRYRTPGFGPLSNDARRRP